MLLLFFFLPHSCATASDLRKRKTPSVRSSHLIRPGFRSGFSKMSLMNSHKWVPLGSVEQKKVQVEWHKHILHNVLDIFCYLLCFLTWSERLRLTSEGNCSNCWWVYFSFRQYFVYLGIDNKMLCSTVNFSPGLEGVGEATGPRGWIEGSYISEIKAKKWN